MKYERVTLIALTISLGCALVVYTWDEAFGFSFAAGICVVLLFQRARLIGKSNIATSSTGVRVNTIAELLKWIQEVTSYNVRKQKALLTAMDKIGNDNLAEENESALDTETAKALMQLKAKLRVIKLEEQRRVWSAQGIALVSEIRKNNAELTEYSFEVISRLIKYLQASQGLFYAIDHNSKPVHLELLATYAYGKRKYSGEKVIIEPGSGLTGQCVLERDLILLTDVPMNYVKITSGLGEALPRCIIIVPLIFRSEVYGVVEIASFQTFDAYQIEFIKKVSEIIAIELSSIRTQQETRRVLEQSQEAELRKTLEEMRATQIEMVQKEEALGQQLLSTQKAKAMAESEKRKNEAILEGCMDAVISFNEQGAIEYFNRAAEDIFGYPREQIIGSPIEKLLGIYIHELDHTKVIKSVTGSEVTVRTEVSSTTRNGEEVSLLLTATKVKMDHQYLFTLFAQKVSVDLF